MAQSSLARTANVRIISRVPQYWYWHWASWREQVVFIIHKTACMTFRLPQQTKLSAHCCLWLAELAHMRFNRPITGSKQLSSLRQSERHANTKYCGLCNLRICLDKNLHWWWGWWTYEWVSSSNTAYMSGLQSAATHSQSVFSVWTAENWSLPPPSRREW